MSAKEYRVMLLDTGFFTGNLSGERLQKALNTMGRDGWRFVRSIRETRRSLGLFRREAHFLVFERDM